MQKLQLFQKPMFLFSFLFSATFAFSQVTEQWAKRYNGPGNSIDVAQSIATDRFGNVYVTGRSEGSETDYDYATVKYNAAGTEIWVRRYNGPGNKYDAAQAIAVDSVGNVYVTGSSNDIEDAEGSTTDIVTIKYDAAGNQLWLQRYNYIATGVNTNAADMAVDAAGNVYITGVGRGSEVLFYITIKYNTSGNKLWEKYYGSEGGGDAVPIALALDGLSNVYVTGQSSPEYGVAENRYTTIKYNTGGTQLWVRHYNNPEIFNAAAAALAVDASGNVYVTGDIGTVKYSAGEGGGWVRDAGTCVAVDGSGNVYVTDRSTLTKYNTAGAVLWTVSNDSRSVAADASGNAYTYGGNTTTKYSTAGAVLWTTTYNSFKYDLALDASGNVYVTGVSDFSGTDGDYATIKYSQSQTVQAVSSFTLINADNEQAIRELKDGDTLNLASLPSLNLNIRANTSPATVGSVVFALSGAQTRSHTENIAPYALFADNNNGDYYAWTPANGNYTLMATPYSGSKGSGQQGTARTIRFYVIYQRVSSFTLVNADTNKDITILRSGDVIDLSKLTTNNLNIRANTSPVTVGSVVFRLSGQQIRNYTENIRPYALFADNNNGDYYAWTPQVGNYLLTATPYEQTKGRGKKGAAYTIAFSVVSGTSNAVTTTSTAKSQQASVADANAAKSSLMATPNPFSGQTTIRFSVPKAGYTSLELYDVKGVALERLYQAQAEAGKVYSVRFNSRQLPGGVYMLRTVTGDQVQSYKLVLIK